MSDVRVPPSTVEGLFHGYVPAESFYDEVFARPGELREAWRELLATVTHLGPAELTRRWNQAQEEIAGTGIAFSVYDESAEGQRPWKLDLLPQLIGPEEWRILASGLRQRASLLNRALSDLYGPQELLARRLLPAEWLYEHPGFRRVFHGQTPPGGTFLHFYAADLARAPDGGWWVVGDRTDAPSGIGYVLENRIASSRMLPHAIRNFNIQRLAQCFMTLQGTLRHLAPAHRENPRIVLLSHGTRGPSFFEDAYLARYLGYTLVEGGDLAVRDDHVFLKTLAGLLPVDVVFRRMSDEFCDPLELGGDGELGVPGLLQAARLGHVAVANAVGSSLVESPSLMPFLPGIAEQWQGQALMLPSVATWWCGQEPARSHVAAEIDQGRLDRLSIRSAFRRGRMEVTPDAVLQEKTTDELVAWLAARPQELIGQESVPRSTSPVWCDDHAARWSVAMRVFLVAAKGTYDTIPCGLVRLARDSRDLDLSILGGQITKDAWVQSSEPVRQVSLLPTARQPVVLRRSGAELPSRVADNLFWFGRHIERAQGACRLLRPVVARLTGEGGAEGAPELECLTRCLAAQGEIEPGFAVEGMKDRLPAIASVLPTNALDENQPGSLRSSVASAHRNASLVRDRLSLDSWRIVHQLERELSQASETVSGPRAGQFGLVELDELLDDLIVRLAALDGLVDESMTRTPARRFLDLGRRLERSLHVVSLVQSLPDDSLPEESRTLEAMLEVADSVMTYHSRYLAAFHRAAALDLLVTDETNPRSLVFQLAAIADHVVNLPRGEPPPLGTAEERIASSLLHSVRMMDVEDLSGTSGERTKLGRLLVRVADQLPKLSDLVSHRYLIHAGRPQQMSEGRRDLP
jgi:uncharacterized circularly permuted ATP-grasp superfamily protein/uncharacterized alpha-E superfamily protein